MQRIRVFGLITILGITGLLAGCAETNSGPPTPQEAKNFKGGTPPPEVAKRIQEQMSKAAAQGASGGAVVK